MAQTELKYCWMLHEIAKDLGAAKNLPAVLNLLVKSAVDGLNLKASSLRLLDPSGERLELVTAYGLSDKYLKKGPVDIEKNPYDKEAIGGKIVTVEDVVKDRQVQYPDDAIREGIRSIIVVPLNVKERVIGSLRGYTSAPRRFTEAEKTYLLALANLGAIFIENARLTESLRKRAENMSKLVELSKMITPGLKTEEIFERVVKAASEMLNADITILSMLEEGQFKPFFTRDLGDHLASSLTIPSFDESSEILSGHTLAVPDLAKTKISYKNVLIKEGIKAMIAAPINLGGKVVGVLKVYFSEKKFFEDGEPEVLSILANLGEISVGRSVDRSMIDYTNSR